MFPGSGDSVNCTVALARVFTLHLLSVPLTWGQEAHPPAPPPPPGAKAVKCAHRVVPQFTDITEKSGIRFNRVAASENLGRSDLNPAPP